MLDAIIDVRTPRILVIIRNAFGGAYASYNNYSTGADIVFALPTTRVAVMGPAGKEFVYKDELRAIRGGGHGGRSAQRAPHGGAEARGGARRCLAASASEAELNAALRARADEPERGAVAGLHLARSSCPADLRRVLAREPRRSCCATTRRRRWRAAARVPLSRFPPSDRHANRARLATAYYLNNPCCIAIAGSASRLAWVRSFACEDMRPLIVCRGPIRKEAIDVFDEMGVTQLRHPALGEGLASSITNALAPELRSMTAPSTCTACPTTRAPPRTSARQRIREIIAIAGDNGYTYIFAGYGFMAEDEEFVQRSRRPA